MANAFEEIKKAAEEFGFFGAIAEHFNREGSRIDALNFGRTALRAREKIEPHMGEGPIAAAIQEGIAKAKEWIRERVEQALGGGRGA